MQAVGGKLFLTSEVVVQTRRTGRERFIVMTRAKWIDEIREKIAAAKTAAK